MRVLTPEEARRFLEHALRTQYGTVFALALTTGMRPSEYLALRWSDIDWANETVTVARTLEKGSGWKFAETKRARSRRQVKLQSWVVGLLRLHQSQELRKGSPGSIASAQIFTTVDGRPINSDYLARCFKEILRVIELPQMRLYDLRHTAATLALAAGVPPKVVSEQLGHANSAFTLDTYSHVLPHMQTEAAKRVEAVLDAYDCVLKAIADGRPKAPQRVFLETTGSSEEPEARSQT
jgi:integrase